MIIIILCIYHVKHSLSEIVSPCDVVSVVTTLMMLGWRLLLKESNTVLWKDSSEPVIANLKTHYLLILSCDMHSFRSNRIGSVGARALADCLKHSANMKELK